MDLVGLDLVGLDLVGLDLVDMVAPSNKHLICVFTHGSASHVFEVYYLFPTPQLYFVLSYIHLFHSFSFDTIKTKNPIYLHFYFKLTI